MSPLTRASTSLFTGLVVSGFVVSVVRYSPAVRTSYNSTKRQDLRNKKQSGTESEHLEKKKEGKMCKIEKLTDAKKQRFEKNMCLERVWGKRGQVGGVVPKTF